MDCQVEVHYWNFKIFNSETAFNMVLQVQEITLKTMHPVTVEQQNEQTTDTNPTFKHPTSPTTNNNMDCQIRQVTLLINLANNACISNEDKEKKNYKLAIKEDMDYSNTHVYVQVQVQGYGILQFYLVQKAWESNIYKK